MEHMDFNLLQIRVFDAQIRVFDAQIRVFDFQIRIFNVQIRVFDVQIRVFDVQIRVFDDESDPQKSKLRFDYLSLDVWRSRKLVLRSKVVEI